MGPNQSRYTGKTGSFIFWCAVIGGMSVVALTAGQWFPAAWAAAMLVLGVSWMFVSVTLDAAGTLEFRGVFRRRRHLVSQLQFVEHRGGAVVFRFDRGGAMLLPLSDGDIHDLVARLRALNPSFRTGSL